MAENTIIHSTRVAGSPYVHSISRIIHMQDNIGTATPDGCWDLVVLKRKERIYFFRTGILTQAIPLRREAGDELLTISLRVAFFMPHMAARQLINKAFSFPLFNNRTCCMNGNLIELPNFENAELFIDKLVSVGILVKDNEIACALEGRLQTKSSRTLRRRFLVTTGLTQNYIQQIVRAQHAVMLIQQGAPLQWVAAETGYYDQSQMTHSLKHIMGQNPGEIKRKGANTTKDLSLF